ncbi:hypothetical protein IGI04_021496 [Brassica rapa subsp. trilocularis]|uniref:Ribosomal protein L18e/L15P domain-containing protein n=1 Tax=Brassica rapa subsp. trilocularis TaxID=1813537 RepID=A0ABQ7LY78_BRACM|nr:hypothetical protein IGI04_021496 [Brassica rapa subsp. trilocularis]
MNYDEVIPSKVHRQEVKVYKVPPLKLKTHTKNYSTNLSFKYSQPHRGGLLVGITIQQRCQGCGFSLKQAYFYVQVIVIVRCTHTLASASTKHKPISEDINYTIEIAYNVGDAIAKSCLEKGITKVAFDRGGYPYHKRIEALAAAAREHGLHF